MDLQAAPDCAAEAILSDWRRFFVRSCTAVHMLKIPGKSCGPCTHCCKVLYIEELKKPAGPLCSNCNVGGGCGIYVSRPVSAEG